MAMARKTFGLRNVWASDGRILHVDYDKITAINATKKQKETFHDQSTNFFRQLLSFICFCESSCRKNSKSRGNIPFFMGNSFAVKFFRFSLVFPTQNSVFFLSTSSLL